MRLLVGILLLSLLAGCAAGHPCDLGQFPGTGPSGGGGH
jgi:hypothetical protein